MTYIQWVHAEPLQLVQGTEQALPLYDPVHGSGPGETHLRISLPCRLAFLLVC